MRIIRGVVDAKEIKGAKFLGQCVERFALIRRTGGHIAMAVVTHLGNTVRQRPAQYKVRHDGGLVPAAKNRGPHTCKQLGRLLLQLKQKRLQHGAR